MVEQHVHLGGAVPIHRLFEAAVDRGIRLPVSDYDEFARLLHRRRDNSGTLERYLEIYEVAERIQSGPQAVRESVLIALNGAARQGFQGLELRFNPMKRNGNGIWDLDRVMLAACSAVDEVRTAYKGRLRAGLLVCLGRDLPWEENAILARKVALWSERGLPVVGIDLAGSESANPLSDPASLEQMAELYQLAGGKVGRTVHCGETRAISLETFLATLKALKPQRVGHPLVALRALLEDNDDRGLRLMAEMQVVAELCVVSNLLTGALESPAEYAPILQAFDRYGIRYTFSTDAPALQKSTLRGELALLREHQAITSEQEEQARRWSLETSFLT